MDKRDSKALVAGVIASLDPKVDASLVYRNIAKTYQTFFGNAFTESTLPTNEKGLYTGLSIKPAYFLKINAYADVFSFPWLRYRVDAPSTGTEYLLQLTYTPNKKTEFYARLRNENKAINISGLNIETRPMYIRPRTNFRTNASYGLNSNLTIRQRLELVWFDFRNKEGRQKGFLTYLEAAYRPRFKPFSVVGRVQYFNTDSTDSRIYSFESDVLYSYSVPQFAGKGFRYYLNLNLDIGKKMSIWLRWAQTIYTNKNTIGSGLDEIAGNKRSEIKLQTMYRF
jgi:hypothetical protein